MEEDKKDFQDHHMEEEESEESKRNQIDFGTHLWGSVDAIKENVKKGANILEGVINFTKSFQKAYEVYSQTISKALEVFERDMLKYNTLDTTTICMSSF
jgi:hypothetical protein